MNKLNIQDLSKLKITTVKQWCINFTYDGEQYFLHYEYEDGESSMSLHHKLNGRKSEWIGGKAFTNNCIDYIKLKYGLNKYKYSNESKWNIVYSQIDKEYFVLKLTYDGFIDSCYGSECKKIKERNEQNNKKIKQLEEEIYKLRQENRNLKVGD